MTDPEEVPETLATYLRLRGLPLSARARRSRRPQADEENAPFTPGRDPHGVGEVLAKLTRDAGWTADLAREDVFRLWADVAGEATAVHTRPIGLNDGTLAVQCDSTAWAKQLRLMRAQILTEITARFPDAAVEQIRFIGPDVPSWKWGTRTVPGRGPRDTYG